MKTILITGALGHLGSYLIHNLPEYNIIAVDNMQNQRFCSLFNLPKNITFIENSFLNIPQTILNKTDIVLHLAARTDATDSKEYEIEFEETNVKFTRHFMRMCQTANVSLFIFPSSCSVYGVSTKEVFENSPKYLNPQSPYAETKLRIEEDINFHFQNGTKFLVLRFGTIFGTSPGMRFQTAINRFCYEARFGKPLRIWKESFEMQRPYLGLLDLLQALKLLINKPESWNQTYNVITTNESCKNILNYIELAIDRKANLNLVDTPLINQFNYTVNFDKIKFLGYTPQTNLKQGIQDTISLLQEKKNAVV